MLCIGKQYLWNCILKLANNSPGTLLLRMTPKCKSDNNHIFTLYLAVLNLPGVEILQKPATNWWRMPLAVTVWSWCWSSEHLSRSECPGWTSIAGLLGISGLEQKVYTVKQWRTSKPQIQLTNMPLCFLFWKNLTQWIQNERPVFILVFLIIHIQLIIIQTHCHQILLFLLQFNQKNYFQQNLKIMFKSVHIREASNTIIF